MHLIFYENFQKHDVKKNNDTDSKIYLAVKGIIVGPIELLIMMIQ